jgi:L-threonylcarbamoyladenylate synthase
MARWLDAKRDPDAAIAAAALVLHRGGLVIFPTETFYGLAAAPELEAAVATLVRLKARDLKAIPLIAGSSAAALRLGPIDAALAPAWRALWPGPLTVVLTPTLPLPAAILGDTGTVGVRVSAHPLARALAAAAGGLVTSTSANLKGQPAAQSVAALDPKLVAEVDLVLDAGACPGGAPSTVLGLRQGRPAIFRSGAISTHVLASLLGTPPEVLG